MSKCPVPLLGRDLLTKFQTIVRAGDPHGEGTHQEKGLLLPVGACLNPKPEGASSPLQVVSQVNPAAWDTEVPGGAAIVRLPLEMGPREAVGQPRGP